MRPISPRSSPRTWTLLALCLAAAIPVAAHAQQLPTPAALAAELHRDGAKAVVARLNAPPRRTSIHTAWDLVTGQIRLGRPAYIALAPRLASGTDAGSSEDLTISLAFALPQSPAAVLAILDPSDGRVLGASRVCSYPFIEDTGPRLATYLRTTHDRLTAITTPALEGAKAACLAHLDEIPRPRSEPRSAQP